MSDRLLSVGLDVGTTSTQLIVSQLKLENRAGAFSVPRMEIMERKLLYKSPVYFTPLVGEDRVDGEGIRRIVTAEYEKAGIRQEDVDTGAVIITGETSRKENARAVVNALAEFAGDFVVATAGPELESILAAKGAGAVEYSAETGEKVLHMDIGGGTSNLALMEDGKIIATGCLNVGGRLIKLEKDGTVEYVSPALEKLCKLKPGDRATREQVEQVARLLVQALEMAAGLREVTPLLDTLTTREIKGPGTATPICPEGGSGVISFSGGVADCIRQEIPWLEYGDIGPVLGQAIRKSRLCQGKFRLGEETIRATVIGAGCHSAQLSGSTVFYRNIGFPLKNLPGVRLTKQEQALPPEALAERIRQLTAQQDRQPVLVLPGWESPTYAGVRTLAEGICQGIPEGLVLVAVEADMAKALGQAMALRLPPGRGCLCIDRVALEEGSYLDVAAPAGPCLPVVVKTLILQR